MGPQDLGSRAEAIEGLADTASGGNRAPLLPRPLLLEPRRLLGAHRLRHTLATLVFASLVCVVIWGARAIAAENLRFTFLLWNLFLAWLPLLLSLKVRRWREGQSKVAIWSWALLWLLFFPNSFYIVTDLLHFQRFGIDGVPRWFDCLMTFAFGCGGMFLGSLSLYLLQLTVRARYGWRSGWCFALIMLGLGAVGIYLGRFARLNSWDVIAHPSHLLEEVLELVSPAEAWSALEFSAAFFLFSLTVYLFIVSMARLHEED